MIQSNPRRNPVDAVLDKVGVKPDGFVIDRSAVQGCECHGGRPGEPLLLRVGPVFTDDADAELPMERGSPV